MRCLAMVPLAILVLAAAASACLWDSDTLRYEARGMPGLVEIMTGRIERQPPLYYEMRLARVTALLEQEPGNLAAYDDAGVACDRLGRGDEAVAWMGRKKARIDALIPGSPETQESLYRYHANLGTFLAHRWARSGGDRSNLSDLERGRDHIAAAIAINPDAHFGREEYQLMAMEWLLQAPDRSHALSCILDMSPEPIGGPDRKGRGPSQKAAIEALSGLIAMGDAWESLDVFYALAVALAAQGDAYMAHIAESRCREIAAAGGRSLHPGNVPWDETPYAEWLEGVLRERRFAEVIDGEELDSFYVHARAEAELWRKEREEFMLSRLNAGRHPDTDPEFWTGFVERPAPTPPGTLTPVSTETKAALLGGTILAVPLAGAIGGLWLLRRARRRRAVTAAA